MRSLRDLISFSQSQDTLLGQSQDAETTTTTTTEADKIFSQGPPNSQIASSSQLAFNQPKREFRPNESGEVQDVSEKRRRAKHHHKGKHFERLLSGLVHDELIPVCIDGEAKRFKGNRAHVQLAAELRIPNQAGAYQQVYEQGLPNVLLHRANSLYGGVSFRGGIDESAHELRLRQQILFTCAPKPHLPRALVAAKSYPEVEKDAALAKERSIHCKQLRRRTLRSLWDDQYYGGAYSDALFTLNMLRHVENMDVWDLTRLVHVLRSLLTEASSNADFSGISNDARALLNRFVSDVAKVRPTHAHDTGHVHTRMQVLGMLLELQVVSGQLPAAIALLQTTMMDSAIKEYPELLCARLVVRILQAADMASEICAIVRQGNQPENNSSDIRPNTNCAAEAFHRAFRSIKSKSVNPIDVAHPPTATDILRNSWNLSPCISILAVVAAIRPAEWTAAHVTALSDCQMKNVDINATGETLPNREFSSGTDASSSESSSGSSNSDSSSSSESSSSESDEKSDGKIDGLNKGKRFETKPHIHSKREAKRYRLSEEAKTIPQVSSSESAVGASSIKGAKTNCTDVSPATVRTFLQDLNRAFDDSIRQDKNLEACEVQCLFIAYLHGRVFFNGAGLRRRAFKHARLLCNRDLNSPSAPVAETMGKMGARIDLPGNEDASPAVNVPSLIASNAPLTSSLRAHKRRLYVRYLLNYRCSQRLSAKLQKNHQGCTIFYPQTIQPSLWNLTSDKRSTDMLQALSEPVGEDANDNALILSADEAVALDNLLKHAGKWAARECFIGVGFGSAHSTMYTSSSSNSSAHCEAVYALVMLHAMRRLKDSMNTGASSPLWEGESKSDSDSDNEAESDSNSDSSSDSSSGNASGDDSAKIKRRKASKNPLEIPTRSSDDQQIASRLSLPSAAHLLKAVCDAGENPPPGKSNWELFLWTVMSNILGAISSPKPTDSPLAHPGLLLQLQSRSLPSLPFARSSPDTAIGGRTETEGAARNMEETARSKELDPVLGPTMHEILHSRAWWTTAGPLSSGPLGALANIPFIDSHVKAKVQDLSLLDAPRGKSSRITSSRAALTNRYYALAWEVLRVCERGMSGSALLSQCMTGEFPSASPQSIAEGKINLKSVEEVMPEAEKCPGAGSKEGMKDNSLSDERFCEGSVNRYAGSTNSSQKVSCVSAFGHSFDDIPIKTLLGTSYKKTVSSRRARSLGKLKCVVLGHGTLQLLAHRALVCSHICGSSDSPFVVRVVQILSIHLYATNTCVGATGEQMSISVVAMRCLNFLESNGVNTHRGLLLALLLTGLRDDLTGRYLGAKMNVSGSNRINSCVAAPQIFSVSLRSSQSQQSDVNLRK